MYFLASRTVVAFKFERREGVSAIHGSLESVGRYVSRTVREVNVDKQDAKNQNFSR